MAQVIIRNLDERVVMALKARAALRGRSLEQTLREILAAAAKPGPAERLAIADGIRAMTPQRREGTDSTTLIREDRER